jgi:hypothetical protein
MLDDFCKRGRTKLDRKPRNEFAPAPLAASWTTRDAWSRLKGS